MDFQSIKFMTFLIITFSCYWLAKERFRWVIILVANIYYYSSYGMKYMLLLAAIIGVSYLAGIMIEREKDDSNKKRLLSVSIVACLSVLFVFKYFDFTQYSIKTFLDFLKISYSLWMLGLALPVGISFYTFISIGYVIDIYRGNIKAEHHLGKYAAFVSFFPQILAGPISRAKDVLPQIKEKKFDYYTSTYGLKQIAWGMFKKYAIADTYAIYVNKVFDTPKDFSGFAFVLASVFYTLQIYLDFSGYSDIAIGLGRLFGIKLMDNFKSPYFSSSIKEFWSRWHISLSSWFRDYVYIPLGGNRVGKTRNKVNLIITFLVSGLWHGAAWTFIVWGGLHGIGQVAEKTLVRKKQKTGIRWLLSVLVVFIFVDICWVFFRANGVMNALYVIHHMIDGISNPITYLYVGFTQMGINRFLLLQLFLLLFPVIIFDYVSLKMDVIEWISKKNVVLRWAIYYALVWAILFLGFRGTSQFIYFQF